MSRSAAVTFEWADGEHKFRLGIGQLAELQEKCDAGPAWIYNRLRDESWRVADITETIRLGLIGGGMPAEKAGPLVRRYVTNRPLNDSVPVAMAVLAVLLVGVPDEPPKKAEGETATETPSPISPQESSASHGSTDGAAP